MKALTREDLMYILQSIFRISEQENNSFQMLSDGLYVEDYNIALDEHKNDTNVHINETIRQILDNFSVTENGILLYNNTPVNIEISSKTNNGITIEEDGLYVPNVNQEAAMHLENEIIHVTQEDKDNWNGLLLSVRDELKKLVIYDIQIVTSLPEVLNTEEDSSNNPEYDETVETEEIIKPSSTTLYLLLDDPDCPEECTFTMHMYLQDKWVKLTPTKQTYDKFALKVEVEDAINNTHTHENKEIIDKFSESDTGELLYNGNHIHEIGISDTEDNAAQLIDGKLYIRDYTKEIKSIQTSAAFGKFNLYNEEINDSGVYELKDLIDNYNLILVEYYYKPNDENEQPGCAKTAVIDTDILNHLYEKNMDYMLEYGYGILMSNSKIRMHGNKLWVDYYHNVCIYRITGIRKGDDNVNE